jgi:hypothetical protein
MDAETEREIVRSRADISYEDADKIVNLVRDLRDNGKCVTLPSLRAGIMIGKILKENKCHALKEDIFFRKIVFDVIGSHVDVKKPNKSKTTISITKEKVIDDLIDKHC